MIIVLGLAVLVGAAFFLLYRPHEPPKTSDGSKVSSDRKPQAEDQPFLEDQAPPSSNAPSKSDFSDTEAGSRLERHLFAMAALGENAEEEYQASLAELKKFPQESAQTLSEVYQKMGEDRYVDRWKVVHTMAALQNDAAFEPLNSIAKAPIPPEKFPGSHGISSSGQESTIRVTAADGLATLAKNGNSAAEAALLQLATDKVNVTLRRRAIRGYLAAGGDYEERAQFLKSKIPAGHHRLIHLDVTPLEDFPLPKPESGTASSANLERLGEWLRSLWAQMDIQFVSLAHADTCPHRAAGAEAENFESQYSPNDWCPGQKYSKLWDDFKMEREFWDDSAGYNEPCNLKFPLGRTFNALWVLLISAPDDDLTGGILRWGYDYAARVTNHLRLECLSEDSSVFAHYDRAEGILYVSWKWIYILDIVQRAGTVMHEAGHYAKSHVAGDCPRAPSCDPNWEYRGANTYEAKWYWTYYKKAVRSTSALKDMAKHLAQDMIDNGFNDPPDITVY